MKIIPWAMILLAFSSCSLVENTRRSLLGEEDRASRVPMIPKAQYDELLRKYEALSEKYEKVESEKVVNKAQPDKDNGIVETVDVFGEKGLINQRNSKNTLIIEPEAMETPLVQGTIDTGSIEEDIVRYRKAVALVKNKNSSMALKIFQQLEKSAHPQIQVRAKYRIGLILFYQGEYDLAMQVFEDIINRYAFSGMVIPSLEKLVICSDKLNLKDKKERYSSILNDIFTSA